MGERTGGLNERVLITGAAGGMGRMLRTRMRREGRVLRLLDVAAQEPDGPDEAVEIVTASLTDPAAMAEACRDVAAVIHLGGLSKENTWDAMVDTNIRGTRTVLEAARAAGVARVVLASSNHAAGFRTRAEAGPEGLPADTSPRPDTYYGVSKAAMEALGSLYHSRFGMHVVCLRIGYCFDEPIDLRSLSTWLSPDDAARLMEACLSAPDPGFRIVWGVSANTRRLLSTREAEELGYRPADDAERYAGKVLGDAADDGQVIDTVGGEWLTIPLGEPL